jgi:type IV secretory pathway TraG/TraD family ATPase VirD4
VGKLDVVYSQLLIAAVSPIIGLVLITFIAVTTRFLIAQNEKITSWLITFPAIVSGGIAALFFRFEQAEQLYSYLFFYREAADSILETTRALYPLYSFSSSLIAVVTALLVAAFLMIKSGIGIEWQRRGAKIKTGKSGFKFSNKPLKLGRISVPMGVETRGFAIFGSTGTGKSQVFIRMAEVARKRGQKAIILDPDGELMSRFFDEKNDRILNPEDERSENWSIFADLKNTSEVDNFAEAIIDKGQGESESWHSSARTLMAVILERLLYQNEVTTADLLDVCLIEDLEVMTKLVKGTEASRVMEGENKRGRDSVITIISQALRPWRRLEQTTGKDGFSLRNWLVDEKNSGWLWMPYSSPESAATSPLRRTWLAILMRELTTLDEDKNRRIWLFLDELHDNGQLDFLPRATARGRKHGLMHVLGIHSISQLRSVYGDDDSQSIMATTGNKILLRGADPETAKYMSEQIGDRETERKERSQNKGEAGKSESLAYQREIAAEILPSEIMNLKDLNGFILLAGSGYFKLKLDYLGGKYPQFLQWKKEKETEQKEEKITDKKPAIPTKKIKLKQKNKTAAATQKKNKK